MKTKLALLLLLILVIIGCPKPAHPPTQDVCGDLKCTGTETNANCPGDCPIVTPPPVCGDHRCDPGESCVQDCDTEPPPAECGNGKIEPGETPSSCPQDAAPKPVAVDHSREVLFGMYVGTAGQPNFDYWRLAYLLNKGKHYTGVSIHQISPWSNLDFYPWNLAGGKYDLKGKLNPVWVAHNLELFRAFRFYDLTVEDKFFDRYYTINWYKPGFSSKLHPFRDNNAGFDWRDDNYALLNPRSTKWLKCSDPDHGVCSPNGNAGIAIERFIDAVILNARKARDEFPGKGRLVWGFANEEVGYVDIQNGQPHCCDEGKSFGPPKGSDIWIEAKWKAAGFKIGKDFMRATNWLPLYQGKPYLPSLVNVSHSQWAKTHGIILEIHSIGSAAELRVYTDAGVDIKTTEFSSDGEKEDPSYPARMNAVLSTGAPIVDFKLADLNGCYHTNDINKSVEECLPLNEKGIWKQ